MSLSNAKAQPTIAVADMESARRFYEDKLGLSGGNERVDGGIDYPTGGGTAIHVYPSPDNAGKSTATLVAFEVEDVEGTVDELAANGVGFEQYDTDPIKTNEKGIADVDGERVAWTRDPDGNILAIGEIG